LFKLSLPEVTIDLLSSYEPFIIIIISIAYIITPSLFFVCLFLINWGI